MKSTTPIGVRTFCSVKPAGRRTPVVSPTGSSKAAISASDVAEAAMRRSSRASRSSIARGEPRGPAALEVAGVGREDRRRALADAIRDRGQGPVLRVRGQGPQAAEASRAAPVEPVDVRRQVAHPAPLMPRSRPAVPLDHHEVVPVHDLGERGLDAEHLGDPRAVQPLDALEVLARVVAQAPGDLAPVLVADGHHPAHGEIPAGGLHPRRAAATGPAGRWRARRPGPPRWRPRCAG